MNSLYALAGLVVGIAIDEAIRCGRPEPGRQPRPRRSPRMLRPRAVSKPARSGQTRPACRFLAQDYYDRF